MVNTIMTILKLMAMVFMIFLSSISYSEEIQWQLAPLLRIENGKAYLDRPEQLGNQIKLVVILLSYDKDIEFEVKQVKFKAKSVVKMFVIDCKSGVIVPLHDAYFDTKMPFGTHLPSHIVEYSEDIKYRIQKTSPLYQVSCPFEV